MIVEFTVENFGPFSDSTTFSMVAGYCKEQPENKIKSTATKDEILSSALIFGTNGAGKSSLLDAIHTLKDIVDITESKTSEIPGYNPFRYDADRMSSPVRFNLVFIEDGVLFDYSIEFVKDRIVYECLYQSPNGRRALVFIRGDDVESKGIDHTLVRGLPRCQTYLAMADQFGNETCQKARRSILGLIVFSGDVEQLAKECCMRAVVDESFYGCVRNALGSADIVIKGIVSRGSEYLENMSDTTGVEFYMRHFYRDHHDRPVEIPLKNESKGTKLIMALTLFLIEALRDGRTILIDDLGSPLHPVMTKWVVHQFIDENNPNGAQLIATTHESTIMDVRTFLRRDQLYFIDNDGATASSRISRLHQYRDVRPTTDVSKDYLDGRFQTGLISWHLGVM